VLPAIFIRPRLGLLLISHVVLRHRSATHGLYLPDGLVPIGLATTTTAKALADMEDLIPAVRVHGQSMRQASETVKRFLWAIRPYLGFGKDYVSDWRLVRVSFRTPARPKPRDGFRLMYFLDLGAFLAQELSGSSDL